MRAHIRLSSLNSGDGDFAIQMVPYGINQLHAIAIDFLKALRPSVNTHPNIPPARLLITAVPKPRRRDRCHRRPRRRS